jgi:L-malate glycosyltransferase
MTKVGILTPCLMEGDAVGNDVTGMRDALRLQGHEVRLFAGSWTYGGEVYGVDEVRSFLTQAQDLLIYHYSTGYDEGLKLLQELPCRRVVKYHNVTPPQFYVGISSEYTNACKEGRAQLNALTRVPGITYWSDSTFNAEELSNLGVSPNANHVVPPFHYIDEIQNVEADLEVIDRYSDGVVNILMVGRLAPNKGYGSLLDAFHLYHRNYNHNSRLIMVGKSDPRIEKYNQTIKRQIQQYSLESSVVMPGGVSLAALKAYYLTANVFMLTSEHEGFCVPLVEAMSMKLPIVAYGSTGVPGTLGKAGIRWPAIDSALFAGAVNCIVNDEAVRFGLGKLGWERYQEKFTRRQIEKQFLTLVQEVTT